MVDNLISVLVRIFKLHGVERCAYRMMVMTTVLISFIIRERRLLLSMLLLANGIQAVNGVIA